MATRAPRIGTSPHQAAIDELEALSRTRALTSAETDQLEHAILLDNAWRYRRARLHPETPFRPRWNAEQELTVVRALTSGKSFEQAGKLVGRTGEAVRQRVTREGLVWA